MSLRYVFGGAGTGKSKYILDEITEKSKAGGKKLIFIVPEQFTLESERQLVALSEGGCIIQPQVLSFNRLALYLFSKTGKTAGKYLDETGKAMLLRKIIFDKSDDLNYFNKSADKQGFMDNLSQTISEFYRYSISAEMLDRQIEILKDRENTLLKISDLRTIFKGFTDYIADRLISTEEMLDILSDKISVTSLLDGCEVWIDGFKGFTPQEFKVMTALMKKAERVTVSLPIAEAGISYPEIESGGYNIFTDSFYEIKRTVNRLSRLAENTGIKIEDSLLMETAWRFRNFNELRFLQKNFFDAENRIYASSTDGITITHAGDKYTEVNHVAESIITLLREKNYKYNDIAVLTGSLGDYEKIAVSVFRQYGIPAFIDTSVDILSHPLAELIRSAVDIAITNYSYESVFRFLKTGLTPILRDDVDYLENYVLAYGIKGYKWKLEDWCYGFENGQFEKERITASKEIFLAAILPFVRALGTGPATAVNSVREITAGIFDMLLNMNVPETLTVWSDKMSAAGNNEMSRRHAQIWEKVCSLFDKMIEILGDEPVSMKQYSKILESGLKTMDMGMIPPSMEQVLVGDIERTRFSRIKALFIIGVNDGVLPRVAGEQGLLSDEDRLFLISNGMELAPDSRRKSFEENLLVYIALCKPEEKLFLSYTTGNLSGKQMHPSSLIAKIKRMFPMLSETDAADSSGISVAKPMFAKTAEAAREMDFNNSPCEPADATSDCLSIKDAYRVMYDWFSSNNEYSGKMKIIKDLSERKEFAEKLSQKSIDKLYGREVITSVSRLEKYAACPYAYFLQYNMNARKRKIYEVQSVDIGNFFHLILEHFTKRLENESISWRTLDIGKINEIVDICVIELTPEISSEALLSTARYKYLIKRVSRVAKKSIWALAEHIKSGDFEIYATELGFKYERPLNEITLGVSGGRRLILTGRVDRIDVMDCDDNRYVKIIDYKSGRTKFDPRDIYFGMQLQLLLYLDIIIKSGKEIFGDFKNYTEILPGGVFYFNFDDPIVGYKPGEDSDGLAGRIYEQFKMTGLALADLNVISGLDRNIDKKSSVIPVRMKDGVLPGQSSIADIEGFDELREVVKEKIDSISNAIFNGDINIHPYKKENSTACDYCEYLSVCGINSVEGAGKYIYVPKK